VPAWCAFRAAIGRLVGWRVGIQDHGGGGTAGGSAKQARDRRFQAVLPLRGKILNVERRDDAALYKDNEISNLIVALGLGMKGEDAQGLRYGKVPLCSALPFFCPFLVYLGKQIQGFWYMREHRSRAPIRSKPHILGAHALGSYTMGSDRAGRLGI
jgi:hypothetical protein